MAAYRSGTGIWIEGDPEAPEKVIQCSIVGNIISGVRDFGIVMRYTDRNSIVGNRFVRFADAQDYVPILNLGGGHCEIVANSVPKACSEGSENLCCNLNEAIVSLEE